MTYRPLTPDHKVDIDRMAAADAQPARSLADLLPPPAAAPAAAPARPAATSRAQLAGGIVVGVIVLLAGLYVAQRAPSVPAAPPAAASRPTAAQAAPSAAEAAPAAPAPAQTLPRAVVAYAAPDGAVLGSIEPGRAYTPTARLGDAWTRITAAGSGLVWVRAAELPADPALPDLATPTPPPPPPATAAPRVIVREVQVPAAPQPTQCATVSGGGTQVQRCGTAPIEQLEADARAAWRAQFGGNTAPVATMTPYGGKP